jgi:hypothetical protein
MSGSRSRVLVSVVQVVRLLLERSFGGAIGGASWAIEESGLCWVVAKENRRSIDGGIN